MDGEPREAEPARFEHSVVAFADALGTDSHSRSADPTGFLGKLHHSSGAVRSRIKLMETNAIGVRWFSDSLLLSCPIGQSTTVGDILGHVGIVQATFAMNGVFLRGAVNIGEHHRGEHIDYGPALSEAADAEKKLAGATTRIIITKRLQPSVEESLRVGGGRYANVCFDPKDGFYFLDFIDILDTSGKVALREHIETALKLSDSRVKGKFQWLAAYYNWRTKTARPIADASAQTFQFDGRA